MGNIALPSLDAILQIKDPNKRFEELVNTMGILIKNLSEINGYLNSKNIRANSITADRMNVNELSAIAADIGHITAGILEAITIIGSEIYGSYIATTQTGYPRAEMSSAEDLFAAYATADDYLKIYSLESGTPMIYFSNLLSIARLYLNGSNLSLANFGTMLLSSSQGVTISSTVSSSNIVIQPGSSGTINIPSWSKLYSISDSQTIQTAISNIYSAISVKANGSGVSGSFETADGKTVTVSNGVIVSMV